MRQFSFRPHVRLVNWDLADSAVLEERPRARSRSHPRARAGRLAVAIAVWTFLLGNAAGLVWLWWHGGNVTKVHTTGDALTSIARLTGSSARISR